MTTEPVENKQNEIKEEQSQEKSPKITTPNNDDLASVENGGAAVSRTPSFRDDDDVSSEIMRVERDADPDAQSHQIKSRAGAFSRLVRTIQVGVHQTDFTGGNQFIGDQHTGYQPTGDRFL